MLSYNNRSYARISNWNIDAKISEDGSTWFDAHVVDIAASGLFFLTDKPYNEGAVLWFDMSIDPKIIEVRNRIKMKVKAVIRSDRGVKNNLRAFGAEFTEISDSDTIRLDELIRITNVRYGLDMLD